MVKFSKAVALLCFQYQLSLHKYINYSLFSVAGYGTKLNPVGNEDLGSVMSHFYFLAQSAGTVKYTDDFSAER